MVGRGSGNAKLPGPALRGEAYQDQPRVVPLDPLQRVVIPFGAVANPLSRRYLSPRIALANLRARRVHPAEVLRVELETPSAALVVGVRPATA